MKEKTFSSKQLSSIIIILSNINDKLRNIEEELCKNNNEVLDNSTHYNLKSVIDQFHNEQ